MPCSLLRRIVHLVSNLLFLHAPVTYPNQPALGHKSSCCLHRKAIRSRLRSIWMFASWRRLTHTLPPTLKGEVKKMLWGVDVTAHIKQFTDAGGIRMTRTFQKDTIRSRFRLRMSVDV